MDPAQGGMPSPSLRSRVDPIPRTLTLASLTLSPLQICDDRSLMTSSGCGGIVSCYDEDPTRRRSSAHGYGEEAVRSDGLFVRW